MRKGTTLCVLLLTVVAPGLTFAAEKAPLMEVEVDLGDRPALQRGARLFVNYCLSCHSLSFMRFKRMGDDLGLTDEMVAENLMFTTDKIRSTMTVAMDPEDTSRWLGAPAPDLSVVARSRGPAWIYSYLLAYYEDTDPARPAGVNNLVFPGTTMPHVLWELQGLQVLAAHGEGEEGSGTANGHGGHASLLDQLELRDEGQLNPAQYRRAVRDIVTFLTYVGEPAKLVRYGVGLWVLLFLVILFGFSWALYKEYWKDVH